ncbi:hypothetical protein FA95DRAFT_1607641 [Auriscalpium vulgare]|uniref:Uncharacterized protein n=1 Tax=Auriscalpium vulgare TaxID=40419 RepID=A0ACB8RPA4_9AGAM|nr:hypothetical protein FA95DRAFT_1607641 [Auriscalpium vulgare]
MSVLPRVFPPPEVHPLPPNQPGWLIVGIVFSALFYGFTSQQIVFYFGHFPQDGWIMKTWALAIWVIDTISTILTVQTVYNFFVTRYGQVVIAPLDNWWYSIAGVTTGTIIFLVHGCVGFSSFGSANARYPSSPFSPTDLDAVRRTVYPTSPLNDIIFIFFGVMALFCFGSSIQLTYYDLRDPRSALRRPMFISNVSIETALDLFITVAMVSLLQNHRGEFTTKKSPVYQLTFFFITRGVVLTVFQVFLVAVPYAAPESFSSFAIFACVSKVYANSALVTLNNRERLARRKDNSTRGAQSSIRFTIPDLQLTSFDTVEGQTPAPVHHLRGEVELRDTLRSNSSTTDDAHCHRTNSETEAD